MKSRSTIVSGKSERYGQCVSPELDSAVRTGLTTLTSGGIKISTAVSLFGSGAL